MTMQEALDKIDKLLAKDKELGNKIQELKEWFDENLETFIEHYKQDLNKSKGDENEKF